MLFTLFFLFRRLLEIQSVLVLFIMRREKIKLHQIVVDNINTQTTPLYKTSIFTDIQFLDLYSITNTLHHLYDVRKLQHVEVSDANSQTFDKFSLKNLNP